MNKTIILLLSFVMILGCKPGNSEKTKDKIQSETKTKIEGNFIISGAYALYPLVRKWSEDFMKVNPAVKIVITSEGTGQGIDDLLAKKDQLAMISRPLTDEELKDGIWVVPVAKEGVAPIVNQKNPYLKRILEHGITPEKLIRLFTGEKSMTWGELLDTTLNGKVIVYTRADKSGAAVVWANFLWKEGIDLKGIKVVGDEEMINSIQGNQLAIGYCNFSYAFDTITGERIKDIQVIPIDLDFDRTIDRKEVPFINISKAHRGLWLGYYPKNLTRELTFGSIGKPTDPAILAFLNYTLTTGQAMVAKKGFCELNDVYIKDALEKLK
ncbi:MAG TPA: substrate-binding domain-containing protein [Bacteroidales bacterium]